MSAVTDAISDVGDAVGDAVSSVGDAVEDVGDFIVDDIVQPVAKTVEKTVQAALDDPVNTAIRIGAFAVGGPAGLAIANGAIALAQGESFETAALSAGKSYVLAEAGQMAGAEAGAYATEAGASAEAAKLASGAASGATRAGLGGGDAVAGALSGAVNTGIGSAASSISDQNFADWARQQASNTYDNAYSPTEQDVLAADPSIKMDFPLSTPTTETGPGYYDEMTGAYVPSSIGGLQSPLTNASGANYDSMNGYSFDRDSQVWTGPGGETYDLGYLPPSSYQSVLGSDLLAPPADYTPESYDPLTKSQIKTGLQTLVNPLLNNLNPTNPLARVNPSTNTNPLSMANQQNQNGGQQWGPKLLKGDELAGDSTGDPYYLQNLRQLYSTITPNNPQMNPSMPINMASGGLAESSTTNENTFGNPFPVASTGANKNVMMGGGQRKQYQLAPLQQLRQALTTRMAEGGEAHKYSEATPHGHKPEFITGVTGYYASGKGTGQSDDIDALLHDGDYVADADLVAALGDGSSKAGAEALEKFRRQVPHDENAKGGSVVPAKIADGEYVFPASFVTAIGQGDNKAGAKVLDKMREAIRAHKRSAPTSKIPPKAKSPLDYLKMAKG